MPTIDMIKVSKVVEWTALKLKLHTLAPNAGKRSVFRGQVYNCYFGENIGSEECKKRPCLILQNDKGNSSSPNTIVAPITNSAGPRNVTVNINTQYDLKGQEILTGYIMLSNIMCISKARLDSLITQLDIEMNEVDEKILTSLGLYKKYGNLHNIIDKDKKHIKKITQENYELKTLINQIREALQIDVNEDILTSLNNFKHLKINAHIS